MIVIERRSALAAHPRMSSEPVAPTTDQTGLVLSERRSLSVLQVSAFAPTTAQATTALATALALKAPANNRISGDAGKSLRSVGPGVWLVVGESGLVPGAATLGAQLADYATVVDLSHARCALQLRGAPALRTLAKYCGLDLDPSVFPTGCATNTRFGHIGMHLTRGDDQPTYELLVFRGYAEFVFEALCDAAAEFGLRVEP